MSTKKPILSLENVSKTFAKHSAELDSYVIKQVTLRIHPEEFVIIYGPSGSGKSTLLYLMAGLETPTTGTVHFHKHDLAKYSADALATYHRRDMGIVFQSFNLIKSLNVWENVALPQIAGGEPYHLRKHRAKHLLKLLGLEKYLDRQPSDLSGGEQQRVSIARALINKPAFLLIDEPTGNLDSKSADEVMSIFHNLHAQAKHTIVLITHNPDYLHFATRIIYLKDGAIDRIEAGKSRRSTTEVLPAEHYSELHAYHHGIDQAGEGLL